MRECMEGGAAIEKEGGRKEKGGNNGRRKGPLYIWRRGE